MKDQKEWKKRDCHGREYERKKDDRVKRWGEKESKKKESRV